MMQSICLSVCLCALLCVTVRRLEKQTDFVKISHELRHYKAVCLAIIFYYNL
jgi:hypothetical protein